MSKQEATSFDKFEIFFNKNQKAIIGVSAAVLIVLVGIFIFKNVYLPKREAKAQSAIVNAQFLFEKDSFQVALDGDGANPGFLQIMKDYKFTKAANLSHYCAGICYLNLKDYDNAIAQLKKYDGVDKVVGAEAIGAIGDAYGEKGDMAKAISYYKDAASYDDNAFTTPMYLLKAGLALEVTGKYKEAFDQLTLLKSKYPAYQADNNTVDKHLARVEQLAK